jgi:diguanylate cyclase (GGDEF)-like protein
MADDTGTTNRNKTVVTAVGGAAKHKPDAREACLVIIYGDDLGRRVPLTDKPTILGRSSKCEVQVDQESVSRNHCRITFTGQSFAIEDLGSTNGTYVNDELIGDDLSELRDGDQLKIGRTILKFIRGGNIETQYHEEIYRLMTVDGLTEVHNKRYFEEMLEREVSRSRRYEREFSLVIFDIDHFKDINDTSGHLAGDAVLRQLGMLVRAHLRRDDIIARIGGEEFGVILPEIGLRGARELAEKLRSLVENATFEFERTAIPVTISLGVAQWEASYEDAAELVKAADERLYEAKRTGRNKVCA